MPGGRVMCHDVSAAAKQFHVDVVPSAEARSCPPNRPNTLSCQIMQTGQELLLLICFGT